MNLKGHLTIGNLINIAIIEYKFNLFEKVFLKKHMCYNYYIAGIFGNINNISNIFLLNIFFLVLLGSIFPDLDQIIKNFRSNNIHYTKYHRQFSHSLLLGIAIVVGSWTIQKYYHINENNYIIYLYFFGIGYLSHIIIDIFFGKGGIPLIYTKSWNSKYRLSIPLFDNEGYIANFLITISYMLNIFIFFSFIWQKNYQFLIYYIGYLIIFYTALQQKNTKNTIYLLFSSILFCEIIKHFFYFLS